MRHNPRSVAISVAHSQLVVLPELPYVKIGPAQSHTSGDMVRAVKA